MADKASSALCRPGRRKPPSLAGARRQHQLSYNKLLKLMRDDRRHEMEAINCAPSAANRANNLQDCHSNDIEPLPDWPRQGDGELAASITNQCHQVKQTSQREQRQQHDQRGDKLAAAVENIYHHHEGDEQRQVKHETSAPTRHTSDHPGQTHASGIWTKWSGNELPAASTHVIQRPTASCGRHKFNSCNRRAPGDHLRQAPLVVCLLALFAVAAFLSGPCQAYQLTNNLIANNLPPKFVQTNAGNSLGGSSSGAGSGANSEIVVRVKEGPQSIGRLIYTLKAEDPDDDALTFGVLGTMASELLRIENTPGNQANVYLRKELDRETTESHQVVITLTDGKLGKGNWITKSMLIIVEDVNDNYPVFGPHRTAISIREDTKSPVVIETLEATDADEGRFGQVLYKLDELTSLSEGSSQESRAGQSIASMFSIETIDGKGVVSLIGQLDYEQRPLYQLRVLAIDRAAEHERLSTSTSILISVEDCEDQAPMFTFAPSITRIPEDLPVGSPIVRLSAIDGDRGLNNPIKYSLVSVNNQESGYERNLFSIGSDSGQISVAHELDRELTLALAGSEGGALLSKPQPAAATAGSSQPGAYVLQVRASEVSSLLEGADSSSAVTTELTIILTDVNDETPQFNREQYFGELLENSAAESLVNFVAGPAAPGQPAAAVQTSPELGARVFDPDQGTNGTFTLHLEGEHGHLFEVWPSEATNEAHLMLKVSPLALQQDPTNAKFFDYEKTRELRLKLVAREKIPSGSRRRFSSADMVIHLRDSNDNYPQFDSELYRVEIPENAQRGMHICVVKALDADSGAFGSAGVRYTEIRGERANKFKLDPMTGVITLKTNEHGFDRETIGQHHLIVEARDNNGQGNRNTTQLLIVLTDINDQRPKFLLDQYEAFIYENELDFQSPLQVQALDGDAPNSPNSRLTYSIVAGDPQSNFTIDPQTGRIRVRSSLVAAPTVGSSRQQSSPRQQQQQHHHHHQPQQSTVAGAGQSSGESDIVIADSSSAGQQTQAVALQATGLDFEKIAQKRDDTRQFNLTIRATDAGLPDSLSGSTQVIVLVYDKNDHAPVFTRPVYSKSIREDAPGGSPVVQVQAVDGDHSPSNSKITYRIVSGASDKFVIDSDSGLISVANGANLDIDRVQGAGQKRLNYLLNILAFDGSFGPSQKSASALANITIIDVNNKAPEFVSLGASQQPAAAAATAAVSRTSTSSALGAISSNGQQASTVFVNEDAPYGLIVTRVFATDLDSSAELRYAINYSRSEARNEDMALVEPSLYRDVFTMEPNDGTIKVSKQLDRELFDQVKLRLQVEDLAAQTADQLSYTYLTIKISDVNDNRPTFKKPLYKAVVNENSISGTSVITLTADDRDLNKTLKYSIEASSPEIARLIRINPKTGEVTVNDKIDRELFPMINVTVKAEDSPQPHSLTGSCQLIVTVRDENDNNPIFLNATHLKPTFAPPSLLARQAWPPAEPPDGAEQPRNHNMQTTGQASSSSSSSSSYRHRSLGLAGEQPAGVSELALDEHETSGSAPIGQHHRQPFDEQGRELALLAPGATARVREDAPIGHQIAYVRAEDADVGNNGRVTYLLDGGSNSGGKFRIDRDSGILSVAQPLDRETQRHFALIIEACDNYDLGYSTGESRRAFTQVNIQVTDINDNVPLVSTNLQLSSSSSAGQTLGGYPTYDEAMQSPGPHEMPLAECLFINEFQPPNEPILTITATDADDPQTPNGQIDLAIINNLPQNEMFALLPIKVASNSAVQPGLPLNDDPGPVASSTPGQPESSSTADLSGFGDPLIGSESNSADVLQQARGKTKRSLRDEPRLLEPGNFYPSAPNGPVRLAGVARGFPPQPSVSTPTTTTTTTAPQRISSNRLTPAGHKSVAEQQMHVVVSQSLREKVGNYTILVRATDRGSPALTSVKLINVCVQDVNNHAPVFVRPPLNHTIRIMENATLGSFVTQVEANDLDHGLNGELQYSLKPTNNQNGNTDWQSFKIDRLSGIISTTKLFNRQLKKYYTLRVQAQDFGRPTSLSSDIDINIMIVNSGKYQPEFEQQQQALQFTENSAPGQTWFTLLQTTNLDDDPALIHVNSLLDSFPDQKHGGGGGGGGSSSSSNGSNWLSSPCYYIIDGDDHEQVFQLDRFTHRLTNQRQLDRERKSNYTLIVQASNNCNKQPHSSPSRSIQSIEDEPTTINPTSSIESATGDSYFSSSSSSNGEEVRRFTRATHGQQARLSKRIHSADDETVDLTIKNVSAEKMQSAMTDSSRQQSIVANWDSQLANDKSLLKVTIKIRDVNDNAPKFTQKIYTGGITTEADFGTTFMIVQAVDLDAETNGQVTYSIVRPIKRYLSLGSSSSSTSPIVDPVGSSSTSPATSAGNGARELKQTGASGREKRAAAQQSGITTTTNKPTQLQFPFNSNSANDVYKNEPNLSHEHPHHDQSPGSSNDLSTSLLSDSDELFVISPLTGEISLNFDPQKHMKGYFEFEILAKDPDGLSDKAKAFIYLLRQDQRVKFVLRLTPQELRQRLNKFRSVMGNITGAIVNIDSYKYHENHDGTVDKKKTSLYLHFVNHEDNTIIDVDKVLTLIDNNIEYLDELYKEFHVLSSEAAHLPLSSGALVDPIDQVRTGLMGVSSFLALILVLVIALCLNQKTRYERQLKAATVSAFAGSPLHLDPDFHSQTNLPNTNLHSQDPNPIWINGHYGSGQVRAEETTGQIDWLSSPPVGANGHHQGHSNTGKRAGSGSGQMGGKQRRNSPQQDQQKLYHSASSGVGMALDEDELDCLSSSEGDRSSDLNSFSGGINSVAQLHYNVATATATPRDSLNSSHGQASSSSGSNSASTTNERQVLYNTNGKVKSPVSQQQQQATNETGKHQTKVKLNNRKEAAPNSSSDAAGSTFGAFKEVTIYTESQRRQQQQQQATQNRSFNYLVASQQQQQQQQQQLGASKANSNNQVRQSVASVDQHLTSQSNKLASQFSASKLQKQSIYVVGSQKQANQTNSSQKARILVHTNGSDVNQGIIKTTANQCNGGKQLQNNLDAKFVPAKHNISQEEEKQQHQEQDQTVTNFETSLSKLSILNLETTEL